MRHTLETAIKHLNVFNILITAALAHSVGTKSITWPIVAILLGSILIQSAQKFIPKREDQYLKALKELEKELINQRTDISKLNILLGMGNMKTNREGIINSVLGRKVEVPAG